MPALDKRIKSTVPVPEVHKLANNPRVRLLNKQAQKQIDFEEKVANKYIIAHQELAKEVSEYYRR